ncbi:probable inactive DNA (cytosine-5)-methyltransferase DRM3 [Pistacia vera]|uniref:probable inactive DNA (cytosine-5)-methyltransferase DRM3 n=1 Tax=Pistacia vera TaxID=55513 RepID=UPI001263BE23|nr:probable inactive DNA (cytosine-5)-methyltransferase DRM3 [Pistacia vera]
MGENGEKPIVPKSEILDFELPADCMYSSHVGNNNASSSGSNVRSSLIGMGFSPSHVNKVIEEKGEDDLDLLLEMLLGYSEHQKSNSQSSDSLDSLFGDKDSVSQPEISPVFQPKEEPDVPDIDEDNDEKRASLLKMDFPLNLVDFALDKLGEAAPINELVDFIIAAQIAENIEKETDDMPHEDEGKNEDVNNETLFGTMDKTLHLLEMGFSENEVSLAIEKFGSDVPISELAESIFSGEIYSNRVARNKVGRSSGMGMENGLRHHSYDTVKIKTEDFSPHTVSQSRKLNNREETSRGKRPKEVYSGNLPDGASQFRHIDFEENHKGKRPKQEYMDDSSSFLDTSWLEEKVSPIVPRSEVQTIFRSNPCKSLDKMVAKSPYFFYGDVVNTSVGCWTKISQFLYAIEPEFVSTQFFSALNRKEGYVHNLPVSKRFHILPKSPMTIEEAIPHTKKWWPSWDTRKQLSCISSGTSEISQLCDRLGKILIDSKGVPSPEQKGYILHHCQKFNLVWAGQYKLSPVDPEYLERILGYPMGHTQADENSLLQRLALLRHCFQTDTLGYHLSVLNPMFPEGLTVLSVFSGIGGAEVTLNRLGIKLKGVISVDTSEANRRILKRWWRSSGQIGELVQIEDIQTLTTKKVESLIEKFGSIDFIVCQNPVPHVSGSSSAEIDFLPGFDFSSFCEFVRVLQRVRSTMQRKR